MLVNMKIVSKNIRECEFEWENWTEKNLVLELACTHRWEAFNIKIKDYSEDFDDKIYNAILKQLRVEVRNAYNARQIKA